MQLTADPCYELMYSVIFNYRQYWTFRGLKSDIVVTQFSRYDRQKGLDKPV